MRLISRHSDVVSQLLPSESYDIGIAELPIDETAVTVSALPDALRRRSCRRAIRWPPRKLLTPALLSGHPMVAPARSLQLPPELHGTFAAAGAPARTPVVEAEFFASLCGLVAAGTGWSIVDPLSAESFSHLGLVARPFEPAILYEIGVFHRRDREPSMLAAAFLELLERQARRAEATTACSTLRSAAELAADPELWRDFNDICDCGGRLAGTESEKRAFALLRERVRAAVAGQCRPLDPRALWRLASEEGDPCACPTARLRAVPSAGAHHRHAARTGSTAEVIDLGRGTPEEFDGACRRHQGPHRAGAARADVRRRHHPSPPQVRHGARHMARSVS